MIMGQEDLSSGPDLRHWGCPVNVQGRWLDSTGSLEQPVDTPSCWSADTDPVADRSGGKQEDRLWRSVHWKLLGPHGRSLCQVGHKTQRRPQDVVFHKDQSINPVRVTQTFTLNLIHMFFYNVWIKLKYLKMKPEQKVARQSWWSSLNVWVSESFLLHPFFCS